MKKSTKVEGEYQRKSIPCPQCGCIVTNVIDTRATKDHTRRRRVCENCSERFSTYELYDNVFDELESLRRLRELAVRFGQLVAPIL